jgi:hypothetical protein
MKILVLTVIVATFLAACTGTDKNKIKVDTEIKEKASEFVPFTLTTNFNVLTAKEKQILPLLLEASKLIDDLYWLQAYGNKDSLFAGNYDEFTRKFLQINYGPWERLNDNKPFLDGFGEKPAGAQFYPADMTKEEFEAWTDNTKTSPYTVIRRNKNKQLVSVPYHQEYADKVEKIAALISEAAALAEEPGFKNYLEQRAKALLTDDYYASDVAWMEMKKSTLDFVVGPIESYEDQLFGYKTSYEAYILVKDVEWSQKLERFAVLLPELQKNLPCTPEYKNETPGIDSDMNVYDAIYYAGDCNAGSKTIAINLPNDERVRADKGSRKLQLKNSMQAKFEKILVPIADLLIAEDQRKHIKFDAFFENTMFHEVAHGLGLGNTVNKSSTVREALKDSYTSIEEGKADILGLWCVYQLNQMGELGQKEMMDNYVTFMAGIFRSVRFGAASAHGKANMMRFNFFQDFGAFERDSISGTYRVNFEKMQEAMLISSGLILKIQGDGDYTTASKLIQEQGIIRPELQNDLNRIAEAGIPRDIVFEQGNWKW